MKTSQLSDFQRLKSRKFWLTTIGGFLVVFATQLGIPEEAILPLVSIITGYNVGNGISNIGGGTPAEIGEEGPQ